MEHTQNQKDAVLRELNRAIQHLGHSEYELASQRALGQGDESIIITRRVENRAGKAPRTVL
jgi:hypothetical protein